MYITVITGMACLGTWILLHGKINVNRKMKMLKLELVRSVDSDLWNGNKFTHEMNSGCNTIYKCKDCGELITEMNASSRLRREHICPK